MISIVKFGNFIFNASNGISVNSIEEKNAPDRAIVLAQPARSRGVTVLSLTEKAKIISVKGTISSDGDATYQSDIRDFVTSLMEEGDLQLTTTDGIFIYEDCVLLNPTSIIPMEEHYNIDYVPFNIQFLAPKGIAISATLTEAAFSNIATSPYSSSVSLSGTLIPEPIITMTLDSTGGVAITNITFLNQETNESISVATQYRSNDVVEIDTKEKTVKYNTINKRFSGLLPAFDLGSNQFKIDVEGESNIAISQETSDSTRSVYGAVYLAQQINPDAGISMPQIDLLVKKFTPVSASAAVLVIAGGGGGGSDNGGAGGAGGGGAGEYEYNSAYTLLTGSYPVTVGAGGSAGTGSSAGSNGNNSVFDTITSNAGGGGGGNGDNNGKTGGSGGGGAANGSGSGGGANASGGLANAGAAGNDGANEGGGGGGSASAGSGTIGGSGTANSISGSSVTYTVGGSSLNSSGTGSHSSTYGSGGGAGGSNDPGNGTNGIQGVVIIRYTTGAVTATGGTITTDGSDTIHTFTTSGTFEVTSVGGNITDMEVRVETDNAGVPSGTIVSGGSTTVASSGISSSTYSVVPITFTGVSLSNATDYHIVIKQSGGDTSNYYSVKLNTAGGYSQGSVETSANSGSTWSEQAGEDLWFRVYNAFPTGFNLDVTIGYYVSHYSVA